MSNHPHSPVSRAAANYSPVTAVRPLVLGSRGIPFASRQAEWVQTRLTETFRGMRPTVLPIETAGDRDQTTPFAERAASGLFTAELETALRQRTIDAAVHSVKHLPIADSEGLVVAAICRRSDPRDVLFSAHASLAELPPGARVGVSTRRRAAQVLSARPDVQIVTIGGDIESRLRALDDLQLDAVVVAAAALERMNLVADRCHHLAADVIVPAPGQGAIAVQCRADDHEAIEALRALDDVATRAAVTAERTFMHAVGALCSSTLSALAEPLGTTGLLRMTGYISSADGVETLRLEGSDTDPVALGNRLARWALARDAATLLA